VYGSPNATADVDYSVYFNTTGEPSSIDSNTIPFDKYTQKQGTGGVIFYVGAMPAGNHRILFVNNGDTPLGESFPVRGPQAAQADEQAYRTQ